MPIPGTNFFHSFNFMIDSIKTPKAGKATTTKASAHPPTCCLLLETLWYILLMVRYERTSTDITPMLAYNHTFEFFLLLAFSVFLLTAHSSWYSG